MKAFKSILKGILTIGVIAGFILMIGENEDGSCNIAWSLSWFAEMVFCGWLLVKLFPETFKSDRA